METRKVAKRYQPVHTGLTQKVPREMWGFTESVEIRDVLYQPAVDTKPFKKPTRNEGFHGQTMPNRRCYGVAAGTAAGDLGSRAETSRGIATRC